MNHKTVNTLKTAIGLAVLSGTLSAPLVSAASNPFVANDLGNGYQLADKSAEGNCGANKSAEGDSGAHKSVQKDAEGKCGENKTADSASKSKEGKCGEAKCGANKNK